MQILLKQIKNRKLQQRNRSYEESQMEIIDLKNTKHRWKTHWIDSIIKWKRQSIC